MIPGYHRTLIKPCSTQVASKNVRGNVNVLYVNETGSDARRTTVAKQHAVPYSSPYLTFLVRLCMNQIVVAEAVLEIHGNLRKVAERSEGPISTSQRHQMAEYIHTQQQRSWQQQQNSKTIF